MTKKLSLLLTALALLFATSCGSSDEGDDKNGQDDGKDDAGKKDDAGGDDDDDNGGLEEFCEKGYKFESGKGFLFSPSKIDSLYFDDIPFPNDLFLNDDGKIQLNAMPPNGGKLKREYAELMMAAINSLDGFGVTSGVFFPVSKDLDKDTVPPSTKEISTDDKILFFELAEGYPRVPTSVFYAKMELEDDSIAGRLVIHPALGHVLKEKTSYAIVVKKGLKFTDGSEPVINPELIKAIAGCGNERTNKVYEPLAAWLKTGDVSLSDIIAATVFTTQTITEPLIKIYEDVSVNPPPPASFLLGFSQGEEDFEKVAGKGSPIKHLLHGQFTAKRYISSSKELLGYFELDGNGAPKIKGTEDITFTLILPEAADYSNIPLVIFQHGLNNRRSSVSMITGTLLPAGFAIACIDVPYHGSRALEAYDQRADWTGQMIPDGFGDDVGAAPALNFTGVSGEYEPGVSDLHPFISRDSFRQAAADLFQFTSLLLEGDITAMKDVAPELAALSFDKENVYYIGQSFGAIIGGIFNAVEARIKGAVLNVGGIGMVFPTLMGSYGFSKMFGPILYNKIGLNYFAVDYAVAPPESETWVNLFQMALEPGDPAGYIKHISREPISTKPSGLTSLLIQIAYDDQTVPNRANEAQALEAGTPFVKTNGEEPKLRYAPNKVLEGSARENLNGVTAAASQFRPSSHDMLGSSTGTVYVEEEFPPFKALEGGEKQIPLPRKQVLKQLLDFYLTCRSGTCEVSDPYVE